MSINILCIGDVVGRPGRSVITEHLKNFIRDRGVDLVVCNAENAAGGSGITPQIFHKLIANGVDVVTLGDHVFRRREIVPLLQASDRIVRPANISPLAAGKRWTVVETKTGMNRVGVVCLLGQLYMGSNNSPWQAVDEAFKEMPSDVKIRVVDFHAEASSEKIAMGWHLNGRASIVFGTHTHIPTADARVLSGGTAFISDVGMTAAYDSVLGRRKDRVLSAMVSNMPAPFDVAEGDVRLCGVLASISAETGKADSVERIEINGKSPQGAYDADDGRPDKM